MSLALSRMNKKQLYEECKKLRIENMKLTLFQDQDIMNENEQLKYKIQELQEANKDYRKQYNSSVRLLSGRQLIEKNNEQLINDVACLEDIIKNLKEKE